MSDHEIKNIPASIQSRLLTQAQKSDRPYNELLQYYAIERYLYRLSKSKYKQKFLLKGALLFQAWGLTKFRPTRDIDLLGYTSNEVEVLVKIIREICELHVEDDGIIFDPKSVRGERIKEDADYEGVRLRFQGRLGNTRLHLQIDVGFADVVSPTSAILKYPVLLSSAAPELRGYPPETVIAEKLQAMVFLGMINSRMKDFYDLWILANRIPFKGSSLQKAIMQTFANRRTLISADIPALTQHFASEKQTQWQAFLSRNVLENAPVSLLAVTHLLHNFLMPVMDACEKNTTFSKTWKPGGPWSK